MRLARIVVMAAALLGGVAARDLPVPAGKGWQHAATGLILPATLDGLARDRLADNTIGEWDVFAEFADADRSVIATVFLFHPSIDDVALWFDRSRVQIQKRDVYGGALWITPDAVPFIPPGASGPATALRQTFKPEKRYASTSLAMIPLGEWLVAVRVSATRLDPAALDAEMTRIVSAIRWPATLPPAPVLVPIADCPAPLAFEKAKTVKPQGSDLILSLLGSAVARDRKSTAKPVTWCRDAASDQSVASTGRATAAGAT